MELRYCVDEPGGRAESDVARGREFVVRGWVFAVEAGTVLRKVRGRMGGTIWDGVWEQRKDVAAIFGAQRLQSGFAIRAHAKESGKADLILECEDTAGAWHEVTRLSFNVHERLLVGGFDELPARGWAGEPMRVAGWCFFPGFEVKELALVLGEQRFKCATGIVRGDVALRFPLEPASVTCGFEVTAVPAHPWEGRPALEGILEEGSRVMFYGHQRLTIGPKRSLAPLLRGARNYWQRAMGPGNRKGHKPLRPAPHVPVIADIPCLKVLCVTNELSLTGGPLYMMEIVAELKRRMAIDPVVVSPMDGPLRQELEDQGIEVRIRAPAVAPGSPRPEAIAGAKALGEEMRREGIHVVYANTVESFAGIIAAHEAGIASIWNIHESEPWRDFFRWFTAALPQDALEELFAAPHRVMFANAQTRALYDELATRDNFCVVPNALDPRRLDLAATSRAEARSRLKVAASEVMLLMVGTVCERKGQQLLVRALAGMAEESWKQLRCFIVGDRAGAYSVGLHQMIGKLPAVLSERVKVVAETRQTAVYFKAADLFVCASRIESYPRVILEAMAHGLPIVTTDVFGIKEQVKEGVNAIFFRAGDAEGLRRALMTMLSDTPRREEMAARAKEVLAGLRPFEEVAGEYQRIIREAHAAGILRGA